MVVGTTTTATTTTVLGAFYLQMSELWEEFYQAYLDCRRRKRGTDEAIIFEMNENFNLLKLFNDIINRTYEVSPSYVFVVFYPKPREVFAANYRDRIVHHWFYNRVINDIEKDLYPHSYSCRKGMGTLKAIDDSYIRMMELSKENRDLCVFKGDIESFFVNIDKSVIKRLMQPYLKDELTSYLFYKIIDNDPTIDCIYRCSKRRWKLIPNEKSLFGKINRGLPIGNLPSQMFANLYLSDFGKFIISSGFNDIFIYVDDFVIFSPTMELIKEKLNEISSYLLFNLRLTLHNKKRYVQHHSKGFRLLGAIIMPYRKYIGKHIVKSFYLNLNNNDKFISYWGLMKHYKTYNIRKLAFNMAKYVYNR